MNLYTIFLAVKVFSQRNWGENLDQILIWLVVAVVLIASAAFVIRDYRRNRFCTYCHSKTVLGWRVEKRASDNKLFRFGRTVGSGYRVTAVLRCSKCGWEVELGK